jgi:hypothetical protein
MPDPGVACQRREPVKPDVHRTIPGARAEERGDRVPNGSRFVPISTTLTFDFNLTPPSLTAVISDAVLEGAEPFSLTVAKFLRVPAHQRPSRTVIRSRWTRTPRSSSIACAAPEA